MKFLFFLLFGMGVFALSLIGYKKYQNTTLYALAIGGIVNANYFNGITTPIECFGLPFGIDSLIYTLFAFCVVVVFLNEGKRSACLITVSSVVAIMFSAVMELVAKLFTLGNSPEIWMSFLTFTSSALASLLASFITIHILSRLQNRNAYGCMAFGIVLITGLNAAIYYPLCALISQSGIPWLHVAASFIGKGIALIYSLIALKLLNVLKNKMA